MAKNTRNYPKSDSDALGDTLRKLRSRVRKLMKENRELRSENRTLLDAWAKAEAYLVEITQGVPLEELLKYRTLPMKVIKKHEKELTEEIDEIEEARKKWKSWREDNL